MKTNAFKKIIKEAVKEAIQEELREVLLEAVKAPKQQVVQEHMIPQVDISSKPNTFSKDKREMYADLLNGMTHTTQNVQPQFQPTPTADTINGSLPEGEVGMDQIMNLMNPK